MNRTIVPVSILLVVSLSLPVHADHCNGNITAIEAAGETVYIDDRSDGPGGFNHWFYLESNGVASLQSGGELDPTEDTDDYYVFYDPCNHGDPDTYVL